MQCVMRLHICVDFNGHDVGSKNGMPCMIQSTKESANQTHRSKLRTEKQCQNVRQS